MKLQLGEDNMENEITCWLKWPLTIEKAVAEVISHLSDEDKQTIANTPKSRLFGLNESLGTYIRNSLGMWANYKGREDSYPHPDSESFSVIEGVWARLQKTGCKL
jgi:hypothetical protein